MTGRLRPWRRLRCFGAGAGTQQGCPRRWQDEPPTKQPAPLALPAGCLDAREVEGGATALLPWSAPAEARLLDLHANPPMPCPCAPAAPAAAPADVDLLAMCTDAHAPGVLLLVPGEPLEVRFGPVGARVGAAPEAGRVPARRLPASCHLRNRSRSCFISRGSVGPWRGWVYHGKCTLGRGGWAAIASPARTSHEHQSLSERFESKTCARSVETGEIRRPRSAVARPRPAVVPTHLKLRN